MNSNLDISSLKQQIEELKNTVSSYWQKIYPVGAIYISVNDVDPTTLFGGSWQRLTDRFLIAGGNSYTIGNTGGVTSINVQHAHTTGGHTLTTNEIPKHNHTITVYNDDFSNNGDSASFENKKKKPGFTYDVSQSASGWTYSGISSVGGGRFAQSWKYRKRFIGQLVNYAAMVSSKCLEESELNKWLY